ATSPDSEPASSREPTPSKATKVIGMFPSLAKAILSSAPLPSSRTVPSAAPNATLFPSLLRPMLRADPRFVRDRVVVGERAEGPLAGGSHLRGPGGPRPRR